MCRWPLITLVQCILEFDYFSMKTFCGCSLEVTSAYVIRSYIMFLKVYVKTHLCETFI